jgi:hypothetical protein
MKQAEDDLTIDLIEGEPVKLTRNHQERMQAMCYLPPKQRPACRDCMHVESVVHFEDAPGEFTRHWCRVGGFRVLLGGFCLQHVPAPKRKGW